MIEHINADLALLSCDAFGLEQGIGFMHPDDAALARKIMKKAKRSVALVTHAKFFQSARMTAATVKEIAVLVTDQIDPKLKADFVREGLDVIEAARPSVLGERRA